MFRSLVERNLPAARAQAAVRVDAGDPIGTEHGHGIEDPVADELRRLDEVGVHVENAQPDGRPALLEEAQRFVAGAPRQPGSKAARVAVGELELKLETVLQLEHVRPEQAVIRKADMEARGDVEALDRPVVGLDPSGTSSGRVVRAGSSIWIQSHPASTTAAAFGRTTRSATSSKKRRRASRRSSSVAPSEVRWP